MEFLDVEDNFPFFIFNFTENSYLRQNHIYCDCILRTCDEGAFSIHKLILSQLNPYFCALFGNRFNCHREIDNVLIPGVSAQVLGQLLDISYGGTLKITSDNVAELALAADYLLFSNIVEDCSHYMINNLTISNGVKFYETIESLELPDLALECYRFLLARFEDILRETDTLADLSFKSIKKLLSDNHLLVTDEELIWKAIVQWTKINAEWIETDIEYVFIDLFHCLRMNEIDSDDSRSRIMDHPFIVEYNRKQFLGDMPTTHLNAGVKHKMLHLKSKPKRTSRIPEEIVLILQRDENDENESRITYVFEMFDNSYSLYRKIVRVGDYYSKRCLLVRDKIHLFDYEHNTIFTVNLLSGRFNEIPSPRDDIRDFHFTELNGRLFAFGNVFPINFEIKEGPSFEAYDKNTQKWIKLETPQRLHNGIQGIAVDGILYAAGYDFFFTNIPVVFERYDIKANMWTVIESPSRMNCSFKLISYKSKIYMYGGRDECLGISIERYDPDQNTWAHIRNIFQEYSPYGLEMKVIQGKLVVFDVCVGGEINLEYPVMYWEEELDIWHDLDEEDPIFVLLQSLSRGDEILVVKNKRLIRKLRREDKPPFKRYHTSVNQLNT